MAQAVIVDAVRTATGRRKGVFAKTDTNRQPNLVARLQAAPLHWGASSATPDLPSPLPYPNA